MPGRIPDRDIAAIRERTRIEDIVGEYVALRRAGGDSMRGLCPFHDEKSPSFHVRPNHGHFHCFGCGEGGDVYSFLQKIEHVSFVESVEQLADRIGYQISYEGGGTSVQRDRGTRTRLVAANAAAAGVLRRRNCANRRPPPARTYLTERNFDGNAAAAVRLRLRPVGWDTMTKHLLRKGFEFKELEAAGLSKQGKRGPIDRFHRRLMWPIRNLAGDVIGFGARKLFDDDTMPGKYVNTPETVLYKKSQVLFGLDLAKREIAKGHQAVVVEGYTDVMAMHLAGVKTAVASCGTAFGEEHLAMLRRLPDGRQLLARRDHLHLRRRRGRAGGRDESVRRRSEAGRARPTSRSRRTARIRANCGGRPVTRALRDLVARRTPCSSSS